MTSTVLPDSTSDPLWFIVIFIFVETGSHYAAQVGLELAVSNS
jgi:hypothetical protein